MTRKMPEPRVQHLFFVYVCVFLCKVRMEEAHLFQNTKKRTVHQLDNLAFLLKKIK